MNTGKPRVIVDVREESTGIVNLLRREDVEPVIEKLEIGDYILSEEVAVERKSVEDFISSIFDGRLFEQVKTLKSSFNKPLLIVEGDPRRIGRRIRNLRIYFGALSSLTIDYGVAMIQTTDIDETAILLACLAKRIHRVKPSKPVTVRLPRIPSSLPPQIATLATLPGIGVTLAKRLLYHFGNLESIFNASVVELSRVEGLGRGKALAIRSYITENVYSKRGEDRMGKLDSMGNIEG
ncbi:MAG: helix-hairpin-helix domain-containing protein [Candidatus Bathyarchaeota archaeon]|nr:helix-hairpin-helix domain-containing protein [Candidatus Bathyarchaeota archaeon]